MKGNSDFGYQQVILPDGLVEWIIHLDTPFFTHIKKDKVQQPKSFLLLQENEPVCIAPHESFELFGIRFFPWGGSYFVSVGLKELTGNSIETELIFKSKFKNFYSDLYSYNSVNTKIQFIEQFLMDIFKGNAWRGLKHIELIKYSINNANKLSVKKLAENVGYSERQLQRIYQKRTGLAPKQFLKIHRFLKVCGQLKSNNHDYLTDLVYDYGYHDQSHFNHEFKSFANMTPTEFLTKENISFLKL